ncbi:MAG: two-component sensor histidine kinase [Rickettsiales bacterium]|nr:MAG: two-component sensor histidine kinase [Rickettsiales bacterium]
MIQNKYIIRLSFIALFVNIVANIILYRYFMIEEVLIKQAITQNLFVADSYKKHIWNHRKPAMAQVQQTSQGFLRNKEFIEFASASLEFLRNTNADISIFNKFGTQFFSNHQQKMVKVEKNDHLFTHEKILLYLDEYFLKEYTPDNAFAEAYMGRTVSSLIPRAILTEKNDIKYEKSFITTYVPIINDSNGNFSVDGVMKITRDITNEWTNVIYLERRIFSAFLIVFLVFFAIVLYNTSRAQRIINKQIETNKALVEEKAKAEMENSAKTDFLANISHELRTPLNAIIGFSEIILAQTYGKIANDQYEDYVGDINASGKHLLGVINDILDLSKASANKLTIEEAELDLSKLMLSSMRFVKPRADKANIQLVEQIPSQHIVIIADQKRLKQALLNLLSNAVKFTPAGGVVTLSVKKDVIKKLVYITVEDTGIGMNDKDIPKALAPFGQVDNSTSRKYDGTGLGLPLTKKLVELMNGSFDLQSIPNEGTKITITFKYSGIIEL